MSAFLIPAGLGYLLGSIPFGLLLARLFGAGDVRSQGSGNIGATNVARSAGMHVGLLTFALDAAKGAVPAWFFLGRSAELGWAAGLAPAAVAGAGAVFGHCLSIWLKGRGGKGIATYFGATVVLLPWCGLAFAVAWIVTLLLSRYVAVASVLATWVAVVTASVLKAPVVAVALGLAALLCTIRHESNFRRLRVGEESKIGQSDEKEEQAS
ncbi:MAG: glycerol-3-phosphate 1-O-acyltransferase PlsY [Acidobacteriota bacterium]